MALSDNLTHYYKLDETSGTNANDEVGTADGTATSASIWGSAGKNNYGANCADAYRIDYGTDLNAGFAADTAWSLSFWIKKTTTSGEQIIWDNGDSEPFAGLNLYTTGTNGNTVEFGIIQNNGAGKYIGATANNIAGLNNGSFHHVVITNSGSGLNSGCYIYIDGSDQTASRGGTIDGATTGTGTFQLGARNTAYWNGYIDEVAIWSRAISSSEVSQLYNSGTGLFYPFPTNITINPSALTLSTTEQVPTYVFDVFQTANLTINASTPAPTISGPRIYTPFVGTGGPGSKYIRRKWPVEEGLRHGDTKQTVKNYL